MNRAISHWHRRDTAQGCGHPFDDFATRIHLSVSEFLIVVIVVIVTL